MTLEPTIIVGLEQSEETALATSATSHRLTQTQRLQVGVWLVEGMAVRDILKLCRRHGYPNITSAAVRYYRHCTDLLEESREYIRNSYMLVGHAEKAVRIRELEDHLSYLLRLRDELGFIETSERQIGYGTNATKTIEKRFAPGLSKEIRETMRDLKAETEGAERAILADTINIQQNTFDGLSPADRDQILNAIAWKPADIPVEIIEDAEGNVIARKPIDVGW